MKFSEAALKWFQVGVRRFVKKVAGKIARFRGAFSGGRTLSHAERNQVVRSITIVGKSYFFSRESRGIMKENKRYLNKFF